MPVEAQTLLEDFIAWCTKDDEVGASESAYCGVMELDELRGLSPCPECPESHPEVRVDVLVTSPAFRRFLEERGPTEVTHRGVDLQVACRRLMHCFSEHDWSPATLEFVGRRQEDACCSHLTLAAIFNPRCPIESVVRVLSCVTKEHLDVMQPDAVCLSSRLQEAMEYSASHEKPRKLVRGDGGPVRYATMASGGTDYVVSTWNQGGENLFKIHCDTSTTGTLSLETTVERSVTEALNNVQDAYARDYYSRVKLAKTIAYLTRLVPAHAAYREGGATAFLEHLKPIDGNYADEIRSDFLIRCTDVAEEIGYCFNNIAPYELHLLHEAGAKPSDLPLDRPAGYSANGIRTIHDVLTIVPPERRQWLWEGMVEFCERMDEIGPHHRRRLGFPGSSRVIEIMEEVGCRSLMYLGIGCDPRVMDTESSLLMSKLMAEGRWEEWCEGNETLDGYFPSYIGEHAWPEPHVMRMVLDHFGSLSTRATLADVAGVAFDVRFDQNGKATSLRDVRLRLHHGTSDYRLYEGCPFNPEFGPIIEEGIMTPSVMKSAAYEQRQDSTLGEVFLALDPKAAVYYAERSVGQDAKMGITSRPIVLVAEVSLLAAKNGLTGLPLPEGAPEDWPHMLTAPVADCLSLMYNRWPESPPKVVTLPYLPKSLIVGELELHEIGEQVESEDEDDSESLKKAALADGVLCRPMTKPPSKFHSRRLLLS